MCHKKIIDFSCWLHQKLFWQHQSPRKKSRASRMKSSSCVPFFFSTQHRNTNVGSAKWINRLAPRRPALIFTTAIRTPKHFYITAERKAFETTTSTTTRKSLWCNDKKNFKLHLFLLLNFPLNISRAIWRIPTIYL